MQDYTYDEVTGQWAIWQWDENNEKWVFLRWVTVEEMQAHKQNQAGIDVNENELGTLSSYSQAYDSLEVSGSLDSSDCVVSTQMITPVENQSEIDQQIEIGNPANQYTEVISTDLDSKNRQSEQSALYQDQNAPNYFDPARHYAQPPLSGQFAQPQCGEPQYAQSEYVQSSAQINSGADYISTVSQPGIQNQIALNQGAFSENGYQANPYQQRPIYVSDFEPLYANTNRELQPQSKPKHKLWVVLGVLTAVLLLVVGSIFCLLHFGLIDFSASEKSTISKVDAVDKEVDKQRQEQLEKEKDEATKAAEEAKQEIEKIKRETEEKAKKEAEEKK